MVLRRRAGETGWQEQGRHWGLLGATAREMPMRGREIAGVGGVSLLRPDQAHTKPKPLVTLKPAGHVKHQVQTNQNGNVTPSPTELRLIQKYMHEARTVEEEGIDEVALRKLVKSTTFKKFLRRLELENEVVELHQQLEREVGLHSTLESALAHASSTAQFPESVLHDLPSNVQRLLTDIAMLEATVLRLETQASALQWDIVHERTKREAIEHTLPVARPVLLSSRPLSPQLPSRLVPASPKLAPASPPRLPKVRAAPLSPGNSKAKSPLLATLKELLHTVAPEPEATQQQFEFCTPPKSPKGSPKSPRQSLRALWTALDGQQPQQTTLLPILKKLNSKDRARVHQDSSTDATTCFPSSAPVVTPSNLHPSLSSPFTPGEPPRTTTPVTPAAACQQPCDFSSPSLKLLNPARLLVSTKRLAFWNFSSSNVDDASPNNRSANPTPEVELQRSNAPEQHDCSSILDEDFTDDVRMRKLRRSRGMKRQDQSLSSSSHDVSTLTSPRESSFNQESPRPSSVSVGCTEPVLHLLLPSNPNRVSEEMVSCMVDIFCHLAEPSSSESRASQECPLSPSSHTGRLSTSSSLSSSHSDSSPSLSLVLPVGARSPELNPGVYGDVMGGETTRDPYKAMGKLAWANIGPYSNAEEVPWLSVGKNQLEYVAHSLGKFRLLVERLAKVDPSVMTHEEKLAFWINLYNALLMHAFLAYGIPRSDLKFFTLMQKAAYCVGGHWFNAAAIECNLLKAKIMLHRPQFALIMALHNKKLTEEQTKFGIEKPEPLVNFALSCGGHSSPMVRLYTPEHIHDELDSAFQDYLRATVGLTSKSRVLLPKLVYNYAREFVDDDGVLEWVCRFLPISQVTVIYECVQQRHRRRLWNPTSPFSVAPYSFAFRYLFPKSICGDLAAMGAGEDCEKKRFHFCM